ncbi:hypothetical protein INT47_002037 [Mucor saturninus]|uniref:Uncharacterized protein n=1 Tax=Mucor saturninus TaxID=64648 RepID=A0A8H7R0S6_9FUNG|nr:hypothetical protein INT47_002037 [Mucor saturninus]
MSYQDYYRKLSLPPVPPKSVIAQKYQQQELEDELCALIDQIDCKSLQERLQTAMDKLVLFWTDKHDRLLDSLETLEQSKKQLEHRLSIQTQHMDKSNREAQTYKARYENYAQQQRASTRRSSCKSGKSCVTSSSSARSSSCSSSYVIRSPLVDESTEPQFYDALSDNEFDLDSVLSDPDSCTLPNSPYMTPLMSPLSIKSSTEDNNESIPSPAPVKEVENPVLKYACGDGFWNTIARGKTNKAEVDTLISNYIRRGGNPNIAKNSDTVKDVKEGYGLIHAIIAVKNTAALQRVLDAGAHINVYPLASKVQDKLTPILLATKLGYLNGVKLLIEKGGIALLNQCKGPYGENALHAAVQSGSDDMVSYVLGLSQTLLLEKADNNGATPLHYACITGKTRIITLFVRDWQCRPDPRDNKGETPLHYAIRNRKLKVVVRLVGDLGVYPNPYILKQVPTPLDLAKSGGLKSVAEYLKSVGAKTTKEMEKSTNTVHSSNSSTFSGNSSASGESLTNGPSTAVVGVRRYLHTKTSQMLRSTFDL